MVEMVNEKFSITVILESSAILMECVCIRNDTMQVNMWKEEA
jgi:hypothetical protein